MRDVMVQCFQGEKQETLLFLAAGIALTFLFPHREAVHAVGVGLVIQPAFMLALDLFAQQRGRVYVESLSRIG